MKLDTVIKYDLSVTYGIYLYVTPKCPECDQRLGRSNGRVQMVVNDDGTLDGFRFLHWVCPLHLEVQPHYEITETETDAETNTPTGSAE